MLQESSLTVLAVDMAVGYKSPYDSTAESENFDNIRNSFYILTIMNQFSIRKIPDVRLEAEGLLRFVLFSKDLRLVGKDPAKPKQKDLAQRRQELAKSIRSRRRRGVVPVFVSTLWFLFSYALSVQSAFGLVGENATAHDLALGMLLGWMPILVLCCIVDRNPLSTDDVKERLNALVSLVCKSLQDEETVNKYIEESCAGNEEEARNMRKRVNDIVSKAGLLDNGPFFTRFAGQGRVRWHYGVAHPILSDLENCYLQEHGRDWMRNENEARTKLVLGSVDRGLFWFDRRQLWHITSAIIFVGGNCLGAYILSYYTPTVGLGCRSLGYLIFCVISLGLLILEFVVWWATAEEREDYRRCNQNSRNIPGFNTVRTASIVAFEQTRTWILSPRDAIEGFLIKWYPRIFSWTYISSRDKRREKLEKSMQEMFKDMRNFSARQWWNILFFIPAELANMAWLIRVVMSQTVGAYVSCWCQTSNYGFGGGYVDLSMVINAKLQYVRWNWITGTGISSFVLAIGLAYIVIEWCLQSHLSTSSQDHAREGLQRTRAFRRWTFYLRHPLQCMVLRVNGRRTKQKTLIWRKNVTYVGVIHGHNPYDPGQGVGGYLPLPPPRVGTSFRDSFETMDRPLIGGVPHIIEPAFDKHGLPFYHRTRGGSDASSARTSMDGNSYAQSAPHHGNAVSPLSPGGIPMDYLRPRSAHTRQSSEDAHVGVEEARKEHQ